MARGRGVKLDVRLRPSAARDIEALRVTLAREVAAGVLAPDAALDLARQVILNATEYRINDGPWKPLEEA